MNERFGFGTRAVHSGQPPDPETRARAPPLYQTTSYEFDSADHAASLYSLEQEGNIYSRISNPTVEILESRIASLQNGTDAVATASGMAAFDAITSTLTTPGDNIVSASDIYGGTTTYLSYTAKNRCIQPRFVDTLAHDQYREQIDDNTAFVHVETIGNPALTTPDLSTVADIAHDNNIPLVVDNTFATPALCRPLDHGADIIWESTTKWIHGAGTTIGGIIVDGGKFDWTEQYHEVAGENPAFHGIRFTEKFEERAFAQTVRHRAIRPIGYAQSPFDAWQTIQGLETLQLRMERHCENALHIAQYLENHPKVSWVSYPGLVSHPTHTTADQYLSGGYGGMIAFGPTGGFDAAKHLCESVELISFLANIGDAKSLIIHPASTTHAQLSPEAQKASGVKPELVRLSIGIEDVPDIETDLEQALESTPTLE